MNTPQFEHCRSKMPNHPQPVPPIYQPEVIAHAVWEAAHSNRRHLNVGLPTLLVTWGNRLAPWCADRYLARTGYASQQTAEKAAPHRPDNLFQPVAGDPGAHGRFDRQAKARSPYTWAGLHRRLLAAGGAAGAAAAVGTLIGARRKIERRGKNVLPRAL